MYRAIHYVDFGYTIFKNIIKGITLGTDAVLIST